VSNIIFVDSPVGAGFSYASTEEGFKSSDTIAIKQLVIFLKKVCSFFYKTSYMLSK
jgi:serine carboxypeptidase-like clade 1